MKGTRRGLIILNSGLLAVVAGLWSWSPTSAGRDPGAAWAQEAAKARQRGQFLMVSGKLQGSPSNAVYIVDTANQELLAVKWDRAGQRLQGLGWRDMVRDGGSAAGAVVPGTGGGR